MLKTLFFNPFYNLLIVLVNWMPGQDIGLAIIFLTVLVKLLIFPLYRQSIQTNLKLKEIGPAIEDLKKKYANDKVTQAEKVMAVYKENNINPLSGFLVILIQIPVFITLFYVFRNDLNVHLDSLYSFVQFPSHPSQHFLGLFDLNVNKNYVLALLTGLTQFIQTKLTLSVSPKAKTELGQGSFADDLTRSMSLQMTYVMPIFIAFIATTLPAAVSLYWVTSNTISIVLELWWRKRQKKSK